MKVIAVCTLLSFLYQLIFVPFSQQERTMLLPTLQLCHSMGELVVMLAQYTRYRIDTFTAQTPAQKPVHTSSGLSYVHSYLLPKDWMKIHRQICKSEDKKLLHCWVSKQHHEKTVFGVSDQVRHKLGCTA